MTEHTARLAPRITIGMLKGACRDQRAIFKAEWPQGADVTIENVRRAQELGLTLSWGASAWLAAYLQSVAEREAAQ